MVKDAKARRQPKLQKRKKWKSGKGTNCTELAQVHEVAEVAGPKFRIWVDALAEQGGPGVMAKHPPGLKDRERADEKATDKCDNDVGLPHDVVRGTLVAKTTAEALALLAAIQSDPCVVAVVKFKNRFKTPTANGFSDFVLQISCGSAAANAAKRWWGTSASCRCT